MWHIRKKAGSEFVNIYFWIVFFLNKEEFWLALYGHKTTEIFSKYLLLWYTSFEWLINIYRIQNIFPSRFGFIGQLELKVGHRKPGEGSGKLLAWTQMSCKMAVNGPLHTNLQTGHINRQRARWMESYTSTPAGSLKPFLIWLSHPVPVVNTHHLCKVPQQLLPDPRMHILENKQSGEILMVSTRRERKRDGSLKQKPWQTSTSFLPIRSVFHLTEICYGIVGDVSEPCTVFKS